MAPIRLAVNRLGLYMCGMVVEWSRRSAGYYKSRGFDSQPFHFQLTTPGKLFVHMCLCH